MSIFLCVTVTFLGPSSHLVHRPPLRRHSPLGFSGGRVPSTVVAPTAAQQRGLHTPAARTPAISTTTSASANCMARQTLKTASHLVRISVHLRLPPGCRRPSCRYRRPVVGMVAVVAIVLSVALRLRCSWRRVSAQHVCTEQLECT